MNRLTLIALLSSLVVVGCADKNKDPKKEALTPTPVELQPQALPTPIPATPTDTMMPAAPAQTATTVTPAPAPGPKSTAKPAPTAKQVATATAKPVETASKAYVVKKGDSLSEIAKAHNTTVKKIMAANPTIKSADKIEVGQKIKLP